jgi:hypothetical protein
MGKILIFFIGLLLYSSICYGQRQLGVQSVGTLPIIITVNADNFALDVSGKSYVRLGSNSNTANQRTVVLNRGTVEGQLLYIEFVGANTIELVDDSALSGGGNLRISGAFNMNNYDFLVLLWNGTDWVQVTRSSN